MSYQQIAISKFGSASTLKVSDLKPRAPGDDEVAIDVAYSGVNFADIQMRLGFYPDAPKNIKVSAKTAGNVKGGHKLLYSK